MTAERRLKTAATTFNYSKMLTPDEFDRIVQEIKNEAYQAGFDAAREWDSLV